MANKMTKVEMFEAIKAVEAVANNEAMVDFINHEIELLNKKATNKKATKTQEENIGYKTLIKEVLADADGGLTVTEIQARNETLGGLSNQRVSALLRQMIPDEVVKTMDKKKAYFALVKAD